ncbi:MAG TPA: hypothetical protein VMX74_05750 [Pirellulales bacterium]|nr:hypothetical protein [Pirellulales bacterium]
MRHELVGYVLGALDDAEKQQVEDYLSKDGDLDADLQLLRKSVEPLGCDNQHIDPPSGLAQRTCEYIEQQRLDVAKRHSRRHETSDSFETEFDATGGHRWTLVDIAVAAGIVIVLGMLVLPAVNHSRLNAQIAVCQNKLREIGTALNDYGKNRHGTLPEIPQSGRLAVAGIYAPKLLEAGLVSDPELFVCDSNQGRCQKQAERIPPNWGNLVTLAESNGDALDKVLSSMGGSYGYNLGYVSDGKYHTVSLGRRSRPHYALMADSPCPNRGYIQSSNHAGNGQNVLFEDLHVGYLSSCQTPDCRDNFYRNDEDAIAAGTHEDDAVVGCSTASPLSSK